MGLRWPTQAFVTHSVFVTILRVPHVVVPKYHTTLVVIPVHVVLNLIKHLVASGH